MRLILLSSLFVVSALAVLPVDLQAKLEEWKNKQTGNPEHMKQFRSRMSNKTRALLQKEMRGLDIEARHRKLEKLAETHKAKILSAQKLAEIKEKLTEIPRIKTDKQPNVNATDLFEVNELAGVSEYLYQGDIQLTEAQLNNLDSILETEGANETARNKRQTTTVYRKWTDAKLYYYMDNSINQRKRNVIKTATHYIQARTCISFYENSTNPNRVKVSSGAGCHSTLGMTGGQQDMSLGDGCEVFGTVAHEFAHALGVWHTHMRSDRDDYVTVDTSKIQEDAEGNFPKLATNEANNLVPYEYGSFMHYTADSFVKKAGDLSIVPVDSRYIYTMGNRQMSFYDIQNLNDFYECSAICKPATSAKCQNGGLPNPRNCALCNCPLGYEGALCNQRPVGTPVACGADLTATTAWKSIKFELGNATDSSVRDLFTMCTHWISGIEFKVNSNQRETNPKICCPEFNNIHYTGNLNPMPVIAWNRFYSNGFTFEYRYS